MKLTADVEYILKSLFENGYRADVVGGPVRDYLLGKEPSDYDITTSADPETVKKIFSSHRTVDTGIKHGTVSLILHGEQYEITTYRVDGEYKDSRHPESVTFTSRIEDDLARRDFTVNAIAYNPRDGITDPYGGRADLDLKVIRAVGDPTLRFTEDALRILRGIRFAATLGFAIDPSTAAAMRSKAHLLLNVSTERIYTEWFKLLSGDFALEIIAEYSDIISTVIPELRGVRLPEHKGAKGASALILQLSLFALTSQEPASDYSNAMQRLKTDRKTRDLGTAALSALNQPIPKNPAEVGRQLFSLGEECATALAELNILLGRAEKSLLLLINSYIDDKRPYRILDIDVGGTELAELGFGGKAIGEMLSELLLAVIDGTVENRRDSLVAYARRAAESRTV